MTDLRARAIALYDAFTHEHRDRRALLKQMAALAGSVAAAEALIAGIAASPAAASITRADDPRLVTRKGSYAVGGGKTMTGYFAAPRNAPSKIGAVMVIHENRGLNPHIEDVTRRLALEGFFAAAPDLLSDQGGTPTDEDAARDMIARIDTDAAIAECLATIRRLHKLNHGTGKVGTVGFCWGGGMVDRIAIAAGGDLDAAVAYYGPAPDPSEAAEVQAPMLLHYAGLDTRVEATGAPWVAALEAAGKAVTAYTYPGVNHAFNNDTSADRYAPEAAALAWKRTVAFLHRYLD
ncbi:MAG TPA: dienelactone hydrolase family protein [Sphingomonas sp.]|nr:dienelactone hydrolase family protein [Sphingomonas sp.]